MGSICEKPKLTKQKTFFHEGIMNEDQLKYGDFQNMKSKVKLEFKIK